MIRLPCAFGDLLLVSRLQRLPDGGRVPPFLASFEIERSLRDPFWRRRVEAALGSNATRERIEGALLRGDIIAIRERRRRVVVELESPDELLGPASLDTEEKHELAIVLFDPWGRRIDTECEITLPLEKKPTHVGLKDGAARIDAKKPGACSVVFSGFAKPNTLLQEPPDLPLDPLPNAELLTRRDHAKVFKKNTRSVAHLFQLARRKVSVIELEHFHDDGAVFLPAISPAPLREGAAVIRGLDALRLAFDKAKTEKNILVTGHHSSLSRERAKGVEFLLAKKREEWAALSTKHGTAEDKKHIREWTAEPLPDDASWTADTWATVFDLYMKEVAPEPPKKAKRYKLVVRGPSEEKENIYPVKMAEITFGQRHAARAQELEALNPHLCNGPWNWRNINPKDEIFMPETWPPEPLLARGFKVVPVTPDGTIEGASTEDEAGATIIPRSVGCGDRHLEHPHAKSKERRSTKRRAEVIFCDGEASTGACDALDPCTTGTCDAYDPELFDFHYHGPAPATPKDVRYVIRGTYFNPLADGGKGKEMPLPPHAWVMSSPSTGVIASSSIAGEDGIAMIHYVEEVQGEFDAFVELALVPTPPKTGTDAEFNAAFEASGLKRYGAEDQEVWIDCATNQWVSKAKLSDVETRTLVRFPVWTSVRKFNSGGFKPSNKAALADFEQSGLISVHRTPKYGTLAEPWDILLDHDWFRSFVQLRYYNWVKKEEHCVPPGVVLRSRDDGSGRDLGGGAGILGGRATYVLHAATKFQLDSMSYYFRNAAAATIKLSAAAPPFAAEEAHVIPGPPPSDARLRRAHYALPALWHARGAETCVGENALRAPWPAHRKVGSTLDVPLVFHLDDVVLVDDLKKGPRAVPPKTRLTLFDHWLSIRAADPKRPHFSDLEISKSLLPAEKAFYRKGEGLDRVTRLIHLDRVFYDLREERITASADQLGKIDNVGARAALANVQNAHHRSLSHMNGNPAMPLGGPGKQGPGTVLTDDAGMAEYHLLDVSEIDFPYPARTGPVDARLFHLLVYLPVMVDGAAVTPAEVDQFYQTLIQTAEWWDLEHPAHPGNPGCTDTYALIPDRPDDKVLSGDKVVKVRHFFGEVGAGHADAVTFVLKQATNPKKMGNAAAWLRRVELYMDDATKSESGVRDVDQTIPTRFVPPHEISHIFGWPDDYIAPTPGTDRCAEWFPYEIDGCGTRLYAGDTPGMMSQGAAMRLRWYWIYGNRVSATHLGQLLGGARYVPRHESFGTEGLTYRLPFVPATVMPDEVNKNPYFPVMKPTPHASGRAEMTLHRLGHDEGTTRFLFAPPATKAYPAPPLPQRPTCPIRPKADRFDAALTINVRFMFGFEPSLDNPIIRKNILEAFNATALDPWGGSALRFLVEPDWAKFATSNPAHDPKLAPYLQRILVNFRPSFDMEANYLPKNQPLPAGVHVWVRVHPDAAAPPPGGFSLLKTNHLGLLHVRQSDCGLALFRYALGLSTFVPSPGGPIVNHTLTASDMQWVSPLVAHFLKDPVANARTVQAI